MKKIFSLGVFLFAGVFGFAQDNHCDYPVFVSSSGFITEAQGMSIIQAEKGLEAKGADPRVIIDGATATTPEQYVSLMHQACPSWQSANGGVKNNLIIFLVFPRAHKAGIFVGQEFGKVLNTTQIRMQYMTPAFRDGDWTRGIINGINQAGIEIEAFQTAALRPNTTVITKQATDYHGLWMWLDGLLFLGALVGIFFVLMGIRRRRQAARDAQQVAAQARNDAADLVNANPNTNAAEKFSKMSQSETFNPDTDGLSAAQYLIIADAFQRLIRDLRLEVTPPTPSRHSRWSTAQHKSDVGQPPAAEAQPQPNAVSSQPTQAPSTTTIINNSPGFIPIPIPIEEPVYVPEEPVVVHESHGGGWSDTSSSSDDSDSGSSWSGSSSSSDYSSSDSTGFSDSSSSSDFGGGDSGSFGGDSGSF